MARKSRVLLFAAATLVVVVAAWLLVLPWAVQHYVNHVLARNGAYQSHIGHVSLWVFRGFVAVRDVEVRKRGAKVPVPLLSAPAVGVSIHWKALLRGTVVAKIEMDAPELNVVWGPTEPTRQLGTEADWRKTVRELIPIRIDHLEVHNGAAHFRDFHVDPKVDVYLSHVDLVATNLTNSEKLSSEKPAQLEINATPMNQGRLWSRTQIDPFATQPTFHFAGSIENADLTQWNEFLRAYAAIDVQQGTFRIDTELAAHDGAFQGYVKPFFEDVVLESPEEAEKKGVLHSVWEGVVGAADKVLENRKTQKVATRIPLSGTAEDPKIGFWTALGKAIQNAFIKEIAPGIEQSAR